MSYEPKDATPATAAANRAAVALGFTYSATLVTRPSTADLPASVETALAKH